MVTAEKKKKPKEEPKSEQTSNPVGRPPKFETVEQLERLIEDYFESCHEEMWTKSYDDEGNETGWIPILDRHGNIRTTLVRPYTVSGLAVHLETSRQTLLDYEGKTEFIDTIKRAKDKIENYAEESLFTSKQTAGVIFNLVNNHKWVNKSEIDSNVKVKGKLEDFFS